MQLHKWVLTTALFCSSSLIAQTPPDKVVSVAQVQQQVMLPHTMVTAQVQSRYQADVTAGVEGRLLWLAEPGTQIKQNEVGVRHTVVVGVIQQLFRLPVVHADGLAFT